MTTRSATEPAPPPIWSKRVVRPLVAGAAAVLAVSVVLAFAFPVPLTLEEPEGLLDRLGLYAWIASAALAALAAAVGRTPADRLIGAWLATLSVLAALREMDMHHRIRPEAIGEWGMRFRADWWLDGSVPIEVKLVWGLVAAVVVALLVLPILTVRLPVVRLLLAGDTPLWLLAGAVVLLGCGYMMDDLMRHSPYISKANRWRIEETCETLGAAAYLAAVACTLRWPLSRRTAALPPRT